ncbi:hypothetical protein M758_6G003900 [Ceratodon purpureus]|uniref:Uncharacterized protein n=1 Tax=Ceratodon purpureus TaxID=3225 RepID=A0A8T0HD38_CERPU|nr:hypothetical protein KC19_6G004000 [Ceratodon purpureus]KAG0612125.1 hypothetical protein M758_6G003900 [Ceratodon purpureus]
MRHAPFRAESRTTSFVAVWVKGSSVSVICISDHLLYCFCMIRCSLPVSHYLQLCFSSTWSWRIVLVRKLCFTSKQSYLVCALQVIRVSCLDDLGLQSRGRRMLLSILLAPNQAT